MASGTPTLNRQTLDFIRDGAEAGDRHRLLFSAAANLGEFGCLSDLAHALSTLREAATVHTAQRAGRCRQAAIRPAALWNRTAPAGDDQESEEADRQRLPEPRIIPVGGELPPMESGPERPQPIPGKAGEPKGKASKRSAGERFRVLNNFVDFTLAELSRAEIAVWLILYRDTRDGTARTGMADLARRAGCDRSTISAP